MSLSPELHCSNTFSVIPLVFGCFPPRTVPPPRVHQGRLFIGLLGSISFLVPSSASETFL